MEEQKKPKPERKRRVHKRSYASRMTDEQKGFVFRCLACGFRYREIRSEFYRLFEIEAPSASAIGQLKWRHVDEINRLMEAYQKNIRTSGIPLVLKAERIARLAKYADIEDERKRYDAAAKHIHAIAEEVGDLKHDAGRESDSDELSAEQQLDRLAEITEQIAQRSAVRES